MSLQSTLAAGRRSAEALMTATCTITRLKQISLDTSTLILSDTDPSDDVIYQGPCRVRSLVSRVQTRDFEGQLLGGQQLILFLPVLTSGDVTTGDEALITDGGEDPSLAGLRARIQGRAVQTQATAHRFPIEVLT